MKSKMINFRADESDIHRWKLALKEEDRELSEVCRAALERIARRVERDREE